MLFFSAFRNRRESTVYAMRLGDGAISHGAPRSRARSPPVRLSWASPLRLGYNRNVYGFDGWTGRLRWTTTAFSQDAGISSCSTSEASCAAGRGRRAGTTRRPPSRTAVYVGVIDGVFSAFDAHRARTAGAAFGRVDLRSAAVWQEKSTSARRTALLRAVRPRRPRSLGAKSEGKILGSATVTGSRVYVATTERQTFVLDARTGETDWVFADGNYSPFVLAGSRGFLVGKGSVYAVENACGRRC